MTTAPHTSGHCPITRCEIAFRVRYAETDPQGVVHHSRYAIYFEMGRTELLRLNGYNYKDLEDQGILLAMTKLTCRFHAPARYDDELKLITTLTRIDRVRIEHEYELLRVADLRRLTTAQTTLVHIDRFGKLQPMPPFLYTEPPSHQ